MKRLIARLDTKGSRLIKGISFEGLRVLGPTIDFMSRYSHLAIDEIHLIDSVASLYQRSSLVETIKNSCSNIRTPIIVGGGITSLDHASTLFDVGADRISLNTILFKSTDIVVDIANKYGAQSVVISVHAKRNIRMDSGWECLCDFGREHTSVDLLEWINHIRTLPFGELTLTSVDNDGRLKGFDNDLLAVIPNNFNIPLTVGGGVSNLDEVNHLHQNPLVSGVLVGSALHFGKITPKQAVVTHNKYFSNSPQSHKKGDIPSTVHILDYNMCNKASIESAISELGFIPIWTNDPDIILTTSKLVIPGVGSFKQAIDNIIALELFETLSKRLHQSAINCNIKTVCICLGMQLLFSSSDEGGFTSGFNIFPGTVEKFPSDSIKHKSTHIGFSPVRSFTTNSTTYQYFVHSYFCKLTNPSATLFKSSFEGFKFVSGVHKNGLIGIQFHPEKSGLPGLQLLNECLL